VLSEEGAVAARAASAKDLADCEGFVDSCLSDGIDDESAAATAEVIVATTSAGIVGICMPFASALASMTRRLRCSSSDEISFDRALSRGGFT
jgi:hypothetical protein